MEVKHSKQGRTQHFTMDDSPLIAVVITCSPQIEESKHTMTMRIQVKKHFFSSNLRPLALCVSLWKTYGACSALRGEDVLWTHLSASKADDRACPRGRRVRTGPCTSARSDHPSAMSHSLIEPSRWIGMAGHFFG